MIYFCCEDQRRELIRAAAQPLNGIDYLEVVDNEFKDTPQANLRQRVLRIAFVRPPGGSLLTRLNATTKDFKITITGGERIKEIAVTEVKYIVSRKILEVTVDQTGDYSTYTLRLEEASSGEPLVELDPLLASVDFSFKVECPIDLDCREVCACPPEVRVEPELDYLAKDFNSFRQLILDRLALLAPDWRERNLADLGITLVELMAYVGDYLSYRQDAVATEAYLGTARQRVSLRRHARLLDYSVHEGCNARAWVQVRLKSGSPTEGVILPQRSLLEIDSPLLGTPTCFSTDVGMDCVLASDAEGLQRILDARSPIVFEPMHDVFLHEDHNEMRFYTWRASRCCLPQGATKATLAGNLPRLRANQVVIFQEQIGPRTGKAADADLNKRHAVRLTRVVSARVTGRNPDGTDITQPLTDSLTGEPITEIEWGEADALPFALCLSNTTEDGEQVEDVSIALGNILLVDHGRTLPILEPLGQVRKPNPALVPITDQNCGHCEEEIPREVVARYRPRLTRGDITHAQPLGKGFASSPAATAFTQERRATLPIIRLFDSSGQIWKPQRDLISSAATAREFVAEIENDGRARIRFGDDVFGMQPAEKTEFHARYRLGNGSRGNVGADTITQIFAPVFLDPTTSQPIAANATDLVEKVTNPLSAHGTDSETSVEVQQYAPQAFKEPQRCVTPADYARQAGEYTGVQRASATVRWTGSWPTIFLTVDRRGGKPVTDEFEIGLLAWLEPWRMAGHDLEVNRPIYVSLELSLFVCVADEYFRSDVKAALLERFSSRQLPDGSRGFFHPDEWTFGQTVRLSKIVAVAQSIPGVRHVKVELFRRQGSRDAAVPDILTFGKLEVARLENNLNFPDHGLIDLKLGGGR